MPSTARQLRQPPAIEAISRVPYFADVVTAAFVQNLLVVPLWSYL